MESKASHPAVVWGVRAEAANVLEKLASTLEKLFAEHPGPDWDSGEWIGVPVFELDLELPWNFDPEGHPEFPFGRPVIVSDLGRKTLDRGFEWVRGPAVPAAFPGVEGIGFLAYAVHDRTTAELIAERRVRIEDRWRILSTVTRGVARVEGETEEFPGRTYLVQNSTGERFVIPKELRAFLDERISPDEDDPERLAAVDAITGGYILGLGRWSPLLPVVIGEELEDLLAEDIPDLGDVPEPVFTIDEKKTGAAIIRFAPLELIPSALRASFKIEAGVVVFEGKGAEIRRSPNRAEIATVTRELRRLAAVYRPEAEAAPVFQPASAPPRAATPAAPPPSPVPRSKPPTWLLDVRSRMDPETVRLNSFAVAGSLPRKWRRARVWEEAVGEEIEKILRTHGDDAFEKTDHRPALLTKRSGKTALTPSAEIELMVNLGSRGGFIQRDKDGEWLVRALRVGAGWVTVGVSWYRSVERLISDRRERRADELKSRLEEAGGQRKLSFADLSPEDRRGVEAVLEHLGTLDDARTLLDAVLRKAFSQGASVVDIPAQELRTLLRCDNPGGRGNERIRRGFAALEELSFKVQNRALKGVPNGKFQGRFVASHGYFEGGSGAHSDGIFVVELSSVVPGVAGLLNEAETGRRHTSEPKAREALTATGTATERSIGLLTGEQPEKRLRQRRKRGERPAKALSTVGPWRKRALCRSIHEERAFDFLEANLTTSLAADKLRRTKREKKRLATPDGLRIYDREWCPILPPGEWVGVLGTHRRNPEAGWRLAGKAAPATGTGGQRPSGLIDQLGRAYPSGGAREERRRAEIDTLRDFAGVLERVGGILVGVQASGGIRPKPASWAWISLDEALELPAKELPRIRWFPFLPVDWQRRADVIVETDQAERVARGEAERPIRVSRSPDEYLAAAEAAGVQWKHRPGDLEPLETWADDGRSPAPPEARPLGERLEERIAETGIRKGDLARAFGVSPATVSRWIRPIGERETKRGSGVPVALSGLVERWVDGGSLPSEEELEAVAARNGRPRRESV
jgi:hypothetical protein